ncbi:MAG: hypothetical protein KBE23_11580 [Chloroflexi bacterium]|nr:hypothetical protein [Chloroflexota bacterium]MBP7043375.1 hypothetical protein [Chloroflexota bacterium]
MKTTHRKYEEEAGDFRRLSRFILEHTITGYSEAAIKLYALLGAGQESRAFVYETAVA